MKTHNAFVAAAALFAALGVSACSGGEKSATPSAATQAAPAAGAPAGGVATATGKVWDVKMYGDDKGYRFDPKSLTISAGDAVRWVFISGGPHDVTFWPDSIPKGTQPTLQADMPNTIAPLTAPMTMNAGDSYTVKFLNLPAGVYHYFCTPHLAMGMVGVITVK